LNQGLSAEIILLQQFFAARGIAFLSQRLKKHFMRRFYQDPFTEIVYRCFGTMRRSKRLQNESSIFNVLLLGGGMLFVNTLHILRITTECRC